MENTIITFLIKEYESLKAEQHKRIEFRDHMIYLTLGASGAIFSFSFKNAELNIALLVLPFIVIVLGWTYLMNDQKISAIGRYIEKILIPKIAELNLDYNSKYNQNWENYLKQDKYRKQRKWIQLFIDIFIYCISGISSIITFCILNHSLAIHFIVISIVECIFLFLLACQFIKYADIPKRKQKKRNIAG